ncbi:MAG: hypothetical protein AB7U79_03845 [Candidatus Izemoplasmatales bacterium]
MEKLTKEDLLKAKAILIEKNLFTLQKQLTRQRQIRTFVMSVLVLALIVTTIYGTLENPLSYTLSNIGNFFDYRVFFIVWAILTGLAIQSSILALFRLEKYHKKAKYTFVLISVIFLVLTALTPALKDVYPFWHLLHTLFAGLHALFLLLSVVPFTNYVARENPRLRQTLYTWEVIIWGGAILTLLIIGKSAIFELWFFVSMILFLLYLSLVLFEEQIVKTSVGFLKDESDLNDAIETLFIDYDRTEKKLKD